MRYQRNIKSQRPNSSDWKTVDTVQADTEEKADREAQKVVDSWNRASMDGKSPFYGWRFKFTRGVEYA